MVKRDVLASALSGEPPFHMNDAAEYLESLATNNYERMPLLEVSHCLLAPGPAVGPGLPAIFRGAVCLDADAQILC